MRRLMIAASSLALVLAACGSDGSDTPATTTGPEGAVIEIEGFQFRAPDAVEVGTTVEVTNLDGATHTWTSNDEVWDSGNLANGETFRFTFDQPGEYGYFCRIHPFQMTGTITVEG